MSISAASFASFARSAGLRRSTTWGVDLVCRAQAIGQCLQLIAAAGGQHDMGAFFGERLGGGRADALRCARDQDALAAQMEIHGITRLRMGCVWLDFVVGRNC
jgi:hypothetical protein